MLMQKLYLLLFVYAILHPNPKISFGINPKEECILTTCQIFEKYTINEIATS